jgi:phosphoglycerol geranylgeranyltransferase
MKNKVERHLKSHKKHGKPVLFLLIDSENFKTSKDVEKMAKGIMKACKKMTAAPAILVGGSSATDQIEMNNVVKIIKESIADRGHVGEDPRVFTNVGVFLVFLG